MSQFVPQFANINFGVYWYQYSNSFTTKTKLLFPPNAGNIPFNGKAFLFRQNCFEQKLKNRNEMVGTKLKTVQWLVAY